MFPYTSKGSPVLGRSKTPHELIVLPLTASVRFDPPPRTHRPARSISDVRAPVGALATTSVRRAAQNAVMRLCQALDPQEGRAGGATWVGDGGSDATRCVAERALIVAYAGSRARAEPTRILRWRHAALQAGIFRTCSKGKGRTEQ